MPGSRANLANQYPAIRTPLRRQPGRMDAIRGRDRQHDRNSNRPFARRGPVGKTIALRSHLKKPTLRCWASPYRCMWSRRRAYAPGLAHMMASAAERVRRFTIVSS